MQRFAQYLGIIASILIIGAVVVLANEYSQSQAPIHAFKTASSTVSVVSLPPLVFPGLVPQATSSVAMTPSSIATSTAKSPSMPPIKAAKAPTPKPAATSTVTVAVTATPLLSSGNVSLDAAATALRGALVNIVCYAPAGGPIHSILGSGILIDSKGIILTNAHVAQYFLLADRNVSCTIRTGSPATNAYKAQLIYISPAWIHANATVLTQTQPTGTGEYDFALLAVSGSATDAPLPASFPYVPLAKLPPAKLAPVVIASFGAQFLDSAQIQSSLYPLVAFGSIRDVFTFGVNTIDDLDLGGSVAAQEGSSGGGVADATGTLVGTITTSTIEGATANRTLSAITASYVRSEYAREMGGVSLDLLLAQATNASIADFAQEITVLESVLTANL